MRIGSRRAGIDEAARGGEERGTTMAYKPKIKSTAGQRKQLRTCGNGVGLVIYKVNDHTTAEFEFYTSPDGRMHYVCNGKPVERLEVDPED
jgi:hypothetical protein